MVDIYPYIHRTLAAKSEENATTNRYMHATVRNSFRLCFPTFTQAVRPPCICICAEKESECAGRGDSHTAVSSGDEVPSAKRTSSIIRNTWIQRDTCIGFVGWRLRNLSTSRRFPKSCPSLAMTISLSGNLLSSSHGGGGGLLALAAFESAPIAPPCNIRD